MKVAPPNLDRERRSVVASTIEDVCRHNGWSLHVVNVRSNHVHVVVSADMRPERLMNAFKSWSTRRLREAGLLGAADCLWARHGSTRYLWREEDVESAGTYVLHGQGDDIGGLRRPDG